MANLGWDDLRFLVALDDAGTLLGAARILNVSHSTVSRHLDRAEQVVGAKLFNRRGNRLTVSDAARTLLDRARGIQRDIQSLLHAAGQAHSELRGTVHLAAPLAFLTHFLAPLLPRLEEELPDIRIVLMAELNTDAMLRGEADIGIRISRAVSDSLIIRRIGACEFGLYGNPEMARRQQTALMRGEPMPGPYMTFSDDYPLVPETSWIRSLFPEQEPCLMANGSLPLVGAAQSGVGVVALGRYIGDRAGNLEAITTPVPAPRESIYIVTHRDQRDLSRVRAVVNFLTQHIKANARSFALTAE